jgi:hypothetical protein
MGCFVPAFLIFFTRPIPELSGRENARRPKNQSFALYFFSTIRFTFAVQLFAMTIHREGYKTIAITALIFGVLNLVSFTFLSASMPWLAMRVVCGNALPVPIHHFFLPDTQPGYEYWRGPGDLPCRW